MIEFRQISKNGKVGYSIACSPKGLEIAGLEYQDKIKIEYTQGRVIITKYTHEELKKDLEDIKDG